MRKLITSLFTLLMICSACSDNGMEDLVNPTKEQQVTSWIERIMRNHYLWYEDLPDKSSLDFNKDPESFFKEMLSPKDGKDTPQGHRYFSYLEKVQSTKGLINANDSYGFDFAISKLNVRGTLYNIALVIYVQKNSPASEAGLKRGDWILGVNGGLGTIQDFNILRKGDKVTLQLGQVSKYMASLGEKIEMGNSRPVEDTPFLKDSIYDIAGKKIGYLHYNRFALGPEEYNYENSSYNTQMCRLFKQFRDQNVEEFVLDLRYNGGGYTDCAQLLASLLAPQKILNETFFITEYNNKNSKNNEKIKFLQMTSVLTGNLNLKRLYVLTGSSTASASELVINGLRAYIPVRTIGKKTFGKTVGMSIFNESQKYGWVLAPVTFHVNNAKHHSNYEDGILPDIEINEFDQKLVAFGDLNDPLLGAAIQEITGQPVLRSTPTKINMNIQYKPVHTYMDNLLMIHKE